MIEPRRLGGAEIRRLLASQNIVPSKALGQNFVTDPNTVERIARLARVSAEDRVVEIGAGLGSLSLALAATGAQLTVVEIDARLARLLSEVLPTSVRIVEADAMHCDWTQILDGNEHESHEVLNDVVLVANLPYNIATPLLIDLLESEPRITRMLVMVQREVGERIAASPGSRDYGQVSVRVNYFAEARVVGRVSPEVFFPRPRVDSVLVEITRRDTPLVSSSVASYEEIVKLVRAGFGGRRKMLRRSLSGLVDGAAFARAEIAPTARAEELGTVQWGKLAACQRSIEKLPTPN